MSWLTTKNLRTSDTSANTRVGAAIEYQSATRGEYLKRVEVERKKETDTSKKSNDIKEKPRMASELRIEARNIVYRRQPKLSITMDQRNYQRLKWKEITNFLYEMGSLIKERKGTWHGRCKEG